MLELAGHGGWARGVSWSPDGKLLATTGSDGKLVIWDASSGVKKAEQRKLAQPIWSVDWTTDGRYLAVGNGIYNHSGFNSQVLIVAAPK